MGAFKQQNSFTGGEISPRLEGRTDLKQYSNSVRELINFLQHSYGGFAKAPGLYFAAETKDSSKESRLIRFQRKIGQSYMMEVGDEYIRFYKDGQLVTVSEDSYYVAATTYSAGEAVWFEDDENYYVSLTDSNTGNDPDSSPSDWQLLEGNIYEIPSPYSVDIIWELGFCQSIDVMWLTHDTIKTRKLNHYSDTHWSIVEEEFIDGPFQLLNATTTELGCSATSGSVTVTANATNGINGGQGFLSTDVGRQIRILNETPDPAEWTWLIITAVTDSTHVTATIMGPDAPAGSTANWKLGAFSETTGWPRLCMFFQQRLGYFGTPSDPQGLWLSQTDAFSVFTVSDPVVDSDACSFSLVADEANDIVWAMASKELAIGTTGGEWALSGAEGKVVSPTSVVADRQTTTGGTGIRPLSIGSAVLFVNRVKKGLHEMAYVFSEDSYNSPDLMLLADHIIRETQIKDIAFQGSPDSRVYCVLNDGLVAILTYKRDQEVVGWARRSTQGTFESVATVTSAYRDVPYFIVNRTINGETKRYVEYMLGDLGYEIEARPAEFQGSFPDVIPEMMAIYHLGSSPPLFVLTGVDFYLDGDDYAGGVAPDIFPSLGYSPTFTDFTNYSNQGPAGQIGDNVYIFGIYTFPSPDVYYLYKLDTFAKTQTNYTIEVDTANEQVRNVGIVPTSSTDLTPVMYAFVYNWESGTDYRIRKYALNGTVWEMESEVSLTNDAPITWEIDDAAVVNFTYGTYNGGGRIAANSDNVFVHVQKRRNSGVDPYQSGVAILSRDLDFVGMYDNLQMTMKDYTHTFSPYTKVAAGDYAIAVAYMNYRYTSPSQPDKIYISLLDPVTFYQISRFTYDPSVLWDAGIGELNGIQDIVIYGNKIMMCYHTLSNQIMLASFTISSSGTLTHVKTIQTADRVTWLASHGVSVHFLTCDQTVNLK